jgi:flagellar hook assembly protein FlgD
MTLVARIVFATLVIATFGAFFVAQRLKAEPGVFARVGVEQRVFSPNGDGRLERAILRFAPREADRVDVEVVDPDGDVVRRRVQDEPLEAGERLETRWDGRDDAGRLVPDGTYRFQVTLRRQGRTVVVPRILTKDTRPPSPRVLSVGPGQSRDAQGRPVPRAELFPNAQGDPLRVTVFAPGERPAVSVFRTDIRPVRHVLDDRLERPGQSVWEWDGTVDGELVPSGTYLVVARSRDRAGNIGRSATTPPGYGEELPGNGGIEVRRLAAGPPSGPVEAEGRASFGVVAGGERYRWRVRRVGEARPRSDGSGTRSPITVRASGGRSGLYLFELTTRTRRTQVPFAVQGAERGRVLVVLPATTWQGRNRVDDDGDGWPNTLEGGRPIRTARIYGRGLPDDVADHVAPLLVALDRAGRRYDLTTDVALARGDGPRLQGHRGVILAGEARWLDTRLQRALRRWVSRGGRLLVAGPGSLRRGATVTPEGVERPTTPTARDLFGFRLAPLRTEPGLTLTSTLDEIDLFAGTDGELQGLETYEQSEADDLVAAATAADGERTVIAARRVGDGLVVRTGLPGLATRIDDDPELQAFLRRLWILLSQRR